MSISLHYQSLLHTPAYNYIREKLLTFNIKTEKLSQKTFFSPGLILPVVLLSLLAMHHHTFFCIATETGGRQVISSVFSLISNISKEVPALLLLTALSLWQAVIHFDVLVSYRQYKHRNSETPISDCQLLMEQNLPLQRGQCCYIHDTKPPITILFPPH